MMCFNEYFKVGDYGVIPSISLNLNATDIAWSSSYIDLHLEITHEDRYFTTRDDINFPIVNFQFLYNHIPAPHAYVVYMSQLIGYSSACELWKISID